MVDERIVWGEGPFSAKLIIIGQNPGPDEMEAGKPFIGGSGRVLDRALSSAGISRQRCYVTNICKHFVPPGQPVPPLLIQQDRPLLQKEFEMLKNAEVILTLGQESFSELTGKKLSIRHNRKGAEKDPNAWLRGCPFKLGKYWVIPAVHPSFIMRTGFIESPLFEVDLDRARRFAEGARPPDDHHIQSPSDQEVIEYVDESIVKGECGVDIETPETAIDDDELDPLYITPIELLGLSNKVGESIGVRPDQFHLLKPLFEGCDKTPAGGVICWTHNGGNFDFYHLGKQFKFGGVKRADTMLGMHLLWSHLTNKDAATCFSIFCDIPYYKNTRLLDPDFYNTVGNCRDTYGALWAGRSIMREMRRFPRMETLFWNHMMGLTDLMNDWRVIGVNTDVNKANRLFLGLCRALDQYEDWWEKNIPLIDWSSPKQLIGLFRSLGLPIYKRKRQNGGFTETVDDEALEQYVKKFGNKTAALIQTMRELRHAGDFLQVAKQDGRIHPRAKLCGQVGGRIQTVDGNVQVIPEEIAGTQPRSIIIPDRPEEQLILVADYSQIEYRLYVHQAGDKLGIEQVNSGDYLYGFFYEDIFEEPFFIQFKPRTKANIRFDVPPWKLLVAKSWPLGFIYGRGVPDTTGLPISKTKSRQIFDKFHRDHPAISPFHSDLIYKATRQGYLLSPFGRMRRFPNVKGQRNEILAFPGQTVAVDVLVRNALVPLPDKLRTVGGRVIFSVHDSVVNCALKTRTLDARDIIKDSMESPLPEMGGLQIPVEIKLGPSWGEAVREEKYFAINTERTTTEVSGTPASA